MGSDFIYTLAMSDEDLLAFLCNTKLSESSDMAKHLITHYYQCFKLHLQKSVAELRNTKKTIRMNNNLREVRINALGLSEEDLAQKLGVSQNEYKRLEAESVKKIKQTWFY